MNSTEILDYNLVNFLLSVEKQIEEGYYVDTSIEGYPYVFGSAPMRVRLFKGAKPAITEVADGVKTITIDGHESLSWLMAVQNLVLQGFKVDPDSVLMLNMASVTMVRREVPSKAPEKSVEDVVEPTPTKATQSAQRGRKRKQEQEEVDAKAN